MAKRRPVTRAQARGDVLARARLRMVLALLVVVPLVFDRHTTDRFTAPKYTVLAWGVVVLVVAMAGQWATTGRRPRWRTGLHWPVLALLAWTALTTATGVNPRQSLSGGYSSYDGLVAAALFAGLFFAVADVVTARHLKTVATVVYLGAGGPVALYGLLQLHDRLTAWAGKWDFVDWGTGILNDSWLWSTFGNPNHLAGFFALLLPIGLVLLVVHRTRWVRALVAGVGVAMILELAYTGARGAWLGAAAGLAGLAALLARDLRRRPRVVAGVAGAVVGVVLLGGLATGMGTTTRQLTSIFDPHGRTTVERTEFWRAAWHMAADRPLVGVGPDAYRLLFNRYQSARYAHRFGAQELPNGPHSVFFAHLAAGGLPELALYLLLLGVAGRQALGALRRLAGREEGARPPPGRGRGRARAGLGTVAETRFLLAGVTAALLAFVVQAAFNTQEVDMNLWFWALLGVLGGTVAGPEMGDAGGPARPERAPRPPRPGTPVAVAAVVLGLVACWALALPWRADRRAARGDELFATAMALAQQGRLDQAQGVAAEASGLYEQAVALQPRRADYRSFDGDYELAFGQALWQTGGPALRPEATAYLERARRRFREATVLNPQDVVVLAQYAGVLDTITTLAAPTLDYSAEAVRVARQAHRANPYDPTLAPILAGPRRSSGVTSRGR